MKMQPMLVVAMMMTSCAAMGQTFIAVPYLPGESSNNLFALSNDASTVVGVGATGAMRWVRVGQVQSLAIPMTEGNNGSRVVSSNGGVVAGQETSLLNAVQAFRWSVADGYTRPMGLERVRGISGDGSTIVGFNGGSPNGIAARWTASGGVQEFGAVQGAPLGPLTATALAANAASFDGSLIVGFARVRIDNQLPFPTVRSIPFIWSAASGTRLLTNADGSTNINAGIASDITSDGSVVVGQEFTGATRLFRWTQTSGYQYFNTTAGSVGDPKVSDDGNSIIALREFWSPSTGVISLTQLLTQAGCNFTGWTNLSAIDISGDGLTIAGNGTNPLGQSQGWVATVPGPGVVGVIGVAGGLLAARRRVRPG